MIEPSVCTVKLGHDLVSGINWLHLPKRGSTTAKEAPSLHAGVATLSYGASMQPHVQAIFPMVLEVVETLSNFGPRQASGAPTDGLRSGFLIGPDEYWRKPCKWWFPFMMVEKIMFQMGKTYLLRSPAQFVKFRPPTPSKQVL